MATTATRLMGGAVPRPTARIDPDQIRVAVGQILNRRAAVGFGVGVIAGGGGPFFYGHGFADIASARRISEETVFSVGSITKTFTAIAVMQLWERGLIDLDAPARDYLRAYRLVPAKSSFRPATIHHLLTHTAGVPEVVHPSLGWWLLGETVKPGERVPTLAEYYQGNLAIRTEPGTRFRYTEHGIATVGQIVEDVTGESLENYLHEHVFEPLGMADTGLVKPDSIASRLAVGYAVGARGVKPVAGYQLVTAAAGGAYSTIRDMSRYVAALLGGGANDHGSVLRPATLAMMYEPHYQPDPRLPGDGLVFSRALIDGHRVVWHGGIVPDVISSMWLAPDDGLGLIAFTNGSRHGLLWLPSEVSRLLGHLLGAREDAVRTDIPQHPEIWPELCGWYRLPADPLDIRARVMFGLGLDVFVRRGRLMARVLTPIPAAYRGFELHPDDADDPYVFRVDLSRFGITTGRVVFSRGPGGVISRVHFELHPLSLEKQRAITNPRLWMRGAIAAGGVGTAALFVRSRRNRGPR